MRKQKTNHIVVKMDHSPEELFDRGQTVIPITFKLKTGNLKQGESATMHINKDHLLQISGRLDRSFSFVVVLSNNFFL